MYIYKITNLINRKIYIGQSQKEEDKKYLGSGKLIKISIKEYGKNNFNKEVIDYAPSKKELNDKEEYWISYYNSTYESIGYNISKGGGGGGFSFNKLSPEKQKEFSLKISKALTGLKKTPLSKEFYENKSKLYKEKGISQGERNGMFGKGLRKWVNKDGIRSLVKNENIEEYLSQNWVLGRGKNTNKFKTIRLGLNTSMFGKYHKPETKLKMTISKKFYHILYCFILIFKEERVENE